MEKLEPGYYYRDIEGKRIILDLPIDLGLIIVDKKGNEFTIIQDNDRTDEGILIRMIGNRIELKSRMIILPEAANSILCKAE